VKTNLMALFKNYIMTANLPIPVLDEMEQRNRDQMRGNGNQIEKFDSWKSSASNSYPRDSSAQRKLSDASNYDVLSKIYHDTNGTGWISKTNWMSGTPCASSWFGVTCTSSNIVELSLFSNSLTGTMSSEIGLLTSMTSHLYLNSNSLTGTIPSEVGLLSSMTSVLYLDTNRLTGTIPSEIGLLTLMSSGMFLTKNSLTGAIPSEIGLLTSMTGFLKLYSNSLTGAIPSEIGLLTSMTGFLKLYSNSLTGAIPSEIGLLTSMTSYLYLYSNNLCGNIPSEVLILSSSFSTGWSITDGNSLGTSQRRFRRSYQQRHHFHH